MQEQVTDFLAGVGAQAVELQTGAEQDTGGDRNKMAVSCEPGSPARSILPITILPGLPKLGHSRFPLPKGAQ